MHLLLFFLSFYVNLKSPFSFKHSGILMPIVCSLGVNSAVAIHFRTKTFLPDNMFYGWSCEGFGSLV